tara:strand:+ start:40 stop:324 length:285 start_codon:yes stop_codon:yes gene_type:complete
MKHAAMCLQEALDRRSIIPYKWVKEKDMKEHEIDALTKTLNQHAQKYIDIIKKVKEMLEINTRVNWDGQWMEKRPVTPNEEFQNILDFIEKQEK